MQLSKFGAILKFAIELERRAAEFYRAAAEAQPGGGFEQCAAVSEKRLSRLERMRRELVNEMLLEPIGGFEQPVLPELDTGSMGPETIQQRRVQIEQARKRFYTTASAKIVTVAPAVSRAFRKMADDL